MSLTYVSRYRILEEIGRGGMGIIYKAEDPRLERLVAVKILPQKFVKNQEALHRFLREAKVAAKLDHSNIIPVYDVGEDNGTFYIVMEYLEGTTLREWLEKRKTIDLEPSLALFRQIAKALEYAHKRKVIHRDIKPENIILLADHSIKVMDFGIAVMEDRHSVTQAGAVLGTIAYISPEQAQGRHADTRSDIYSLGILLFEVLTGHLPFRAETPSQMLAQHLLTPPPPPSKLNPNLSRELDNIVLKCLVKNPEDRYQTVTLMIQELDKVFPKEKPGGEFLGTPAENQGFQTANPLPAPAPAATPVEQKEKSKIANELNQLLSQETSPETLEQLLKNPAANVELSVDLFAKYRRTGEVVPPEYRDDRSAGFESLQIPCLRCGSLNPATEPSCCICGSLLAGLLPEWETILQPGIALYYDGKYAESFSFFQELLRSKPGTGGAFFYSGLCSLQQKQYHEALSAFRNEVEISSTCGPAWEALGDAAALLLLETDAEEAYREAIRLFPTATLWWKLAEIQGKQERLEEAERSLQQARELNPLHRAALLKSAEICIKRGKYDQAQQFLQQVLDVNRNDPDAHRLLGQLYEKTDRYGQALQAYEKALSEQPNDSNLLLLLGKLHEKQNKTDLAISELKKAVRENPERADTFEKLGDLYLKKKEEDAALLHFEKAVQLDQNDPHLHKKLGSLYLRRNDLDKALIQLEWALALDSSDSDVHRQLAQVYLHRKETQLSIREYKKAIQLDPYNPELHESLGMVFYTREEFDKATEAMQKAVLLDPENVEYRKALGVMYESKGKLDLARQEYQKAMEAAPQDALLHGLLGRIYLQQDLTHLALYQFQTSLGLNPKSRLVQSLLGKTYLRLGQFENAAASFRNALELTKKSAHPRAKQILGKTYFYLGQSLVELKKHKEAEEALEQSIQLLPNFSRAYQWLGKSNALRGEKQKAIPWFVRAVLLAPADADIFAELLETAEEVNDWETPIRFLCQAIESEPDKPKLRAYLGELYARKGNLEEAIRWYEKAVQEEEHSQDIYHDRIGQLFMTTQSFSDAATHFESAAQISPQNWRYHQALASAYKGMGKKKKALAELEIAQKIGPEKNFLSGIKQEIENLKR